MKSFKWTLVLIAVVGGLVVFTVFDNKRFAKKEERQEKDKSLVRLGLEKLNRVEIVNRSGSIVLERNSKNEKSREWQLTSPFADLADQQAVLSFLSALESEKMSAIVVGESEFKATSLSTFGLQEPLTRLRLKTDDGQEQEIKIGTTKAYDSSLYAQINSEPKVLLVSSAWDVHLTKPAFDFRDKHLLRKEFQASEIERLRLRYGKEKEIEIARKGEDWKVSKGATEFPLNNEKVSSYLEQLKGIRALSFVEGKNLESAKKALKSSKFAISIFTKKGNDSPDEMSLSFAAQQPSVDSIGEQKSLKFKSDVTPPAGDVYAASGDLKEISFVNRQLFDSINKTEQDFYDRKLPFVFLTNEIEKIKIESKILTAQFEKQKGEWIFVGESSKKLAESVKLNENINQLISKLSSMEASKILGTSAGRDGEPSALKKFSKLVFMKNDGAPVFEFNWAEAVAELNLKEKDSKVIERYVLAQTNKSNHFLNLSEKVIQSLEIENFIKKEIPAALPQQSGPQDAQALPGRGK